MIILYCVLFKFCQACSVTAPRKIIDMDIVEKTLLDSPTSQTSSSSKKFKQILLEIEQVIHVS